MLLKRLEPIGSSLFFFNLYNKHNFQYLCLEITGLQ